MLSKKMATRTAAAIHAQPRSTKPAVNLGLSILLLAATILFVQTNNTTRPVTPITIPNSLLQFSPHALKANVNTPAVNQTVPTAQITKNVDDKKAATPSSNNLQIATATIKHSLSAAARQAGLSSKLAAQVNTIFNSKIDVHPGDFLKVLYQTHITDGRKITEIIAAEITHKGKSYKAIRFTDPQGHTGYYAPDGKSFAKAAFTRYPVNFKRISSPFSNMRWHPLLHMYRKHTGVDYAAPYGSPIKAAGDGKVTFVGTDNGYGRAVIIRHNNEITTLYGHMSRYAKGITAGKIVKIGQVIGYVGSSGLSSGPHLHFEYRIKNVPVNPLKVVLPDAPPLAAKYMHDFLAQARNVLAQLDSHNMLAMK